MTGGVPVAAAHRRRARVDPGLRDLRRPEPSPSPPSVPPATHRRSPRASSYALRTFVTGHGQGNADNCAEFCGKTHTLTAGKTPHAKMIWRTDCATTAAPEASKGPTSTRARAGAPAPT